MSTTTIGSMTLGTAANLTGAAKLEFEDSAGTSVYFTAATLRTKMFAGGTGYTAADPLIAGAITASGVVTGNAGVSTTFVQIATGGDLVLPGGGFGVTNGSTRFIAVASGANPAVTLGSTGGLIVTGTATFSSVAITVASATGSAGLRLPHGAAPTSPTNGDMWTTTAGAFIRINGVTKTFTLT